MKDILAAPFVRQMCDAAANMYRLGWDERNGGNISMMIDKSLAEEFLDLNKVLRVIPVAFDGKELAGKILIVTGTGKYFKNVADNPEENLGIIRIAANGREAELIWGFSDGGRPTSELPAHLMTHAARLKVDPAHHVVIHTHATNVLAMSFVHPLEERAFTRTLWQMMTECLVVFPDGVGVLPWMLCGNDAIGQETAKKMQEYRLVVWAQHGIFGAGRDMDETFGLIETVEKAAEVYLKIAHLPILQKITDEELWTLADAFSVTPHAGFLSQRK